MSKIPVSYIFLLPLITGILLSKIFFFPPEFLLIFFFTSAIITSGLSFVFKKISVIFLTLFIVVTGFFLTEYFHNQDDITLPIPTEKIVASYGVVKDIREKGPLINLSIKNAMISDGKNWFPTRHIIKISIPAEVKICTSDWIYIYEIKSAKKSDDAIIIKANSWKIFQPTSHFDIFLKKIRLDTERIVKHWFRYHPQEAAIFKMMVLGDKRQSLEIKEIFIKTGTYHLLIVSGLHLGYLVIFLRIIFFLVRKYEQAYYKVFDLIYLSAIIFYSAITGFSTPVMRAALMLTIYLIGEIIERPVSGIDSIGWAGFFILFFNPDELFNLGFQLSFSATTGIVFALRNIPEMKKIPTWLDSSIRAVSGAQIFTMPVLAINTGHFYPLGLISNLVLVPIGAITVFLGLAFLIFGFLRAIIIYPLLKALDFFWISTKIFSGFSPEVSWTPDIPILIGIYCLIFLFFFRNNWKIFLPFAVISFSAHFVFPQKVIKEEISGLSEHEIDKECITFFPCKKLLCAVEKKDRIILILSERENTETLKPVLENIKNKNKKIVLFFTGVPHDTISQIELILNFVKPVSIIDNPGIKKNPAFVYRKCFFLPDTGIRQEFWNFLENYQGIRVVYNAKDTQVLEYRGENGIVIISNYMNSRIFEVLPFSPNYHTIYATNLALSNKLAQYLEEYETKYIVYQKSVYDNLEITYSFKLLHIDKGLTIR